MSDSSRHNLFLVPEVTYGVTPASPAFGNVRHNACTLALAKSPLQSEEARADRQLSDVRHGTRQVGGDITAELSYGSFDLLLAALLCGTWAPLATVAASDISFANADSSLNSVGGDFGDFAGLTAGEVLTVSGSASNDGDYTIVSATASKIIVTEAVVDEAAGAAVTVATPGELLQAGIDRNSFSMLRHFTDIAAAGDGKPYHLFTGVEVNTGAFTFSPEAIAQVVFGVIGKGLTIGNDAPASSTFGSASTTAPFDSFSGAILEGGVAIGIVTELTANLENGLAPRFVIGSAETLRPSIGRSLLSGQATVYFEDAVMLEKFINETDSSLQFTLPDGAGNSYEFVFPRVKYNGGQPDTSGTGPITLAMPFQALYDATSATQIQITRRPA